MATTLNAGDVQLAATSPRLITVTLPGNIEVPAVKSVKITATNTMFRGNASGTVYTPSTITLTANLIQLSGAGNPLFTVTSGTAELTGTGNTRTIAVTGMLTDSITVRAEVTVSGITYSDVITIVKVRDGTNGINGLNIVLSNDSHVIPTDSLGNNGVYTGATSTVYVYQGSTDDTANWTITATPSAGVTSTFASNIIEVSDLTAQNGYVDVLATRSGYSSLTARFTLAQARGGVTGQDASAYWIVSSAAAIQKTIAGVYTPSSITFSAYRATGTAGPVAYAGRFIIDSNTVTDPTYTNAQTSSVDETSRSYTIAANTKTVRARLYLAGGTTTLIDEEVVPVVSDGATGAAAKLITITANSQIFRVSSSGTSTPTDITFTASGQNLTGSPTFSVASGTATLTGTGNTRNLTFANLTTETATITATQDGVSDSITISKVRDGTNGIVPVISNSSHTLPASNAGVVSSYAGSGTTIQVFEGSTALTAVASITASSQFTIGTRTASGTITIGTPSYAGTTATIANHSAMDNAVDTLTITYPITARRADGTNLTFNLIQTITKSKAGATGSTGSTGATGTRGNVNVSISGQSVWSDAVANNYFNTTYSGVKVLNDIVTQYGANFSESRFWNTTSNTWSSISAYISGNLVVDNTLSATKIIASSITAAQIAGNTITANQIAASTITAAKIATGTITANEIAGNTITANQIAASTITAAKIATGTITATQIATGTITANELGANSVIASKIQAGAVTADKVNGQNLVVYAGTYTGAHAWPAAGVGGGFNLSSSGLLLGNYSNTSMGYAEIGSNGFFSVGRNGGSSITFNPTTGVFSGSNVVDTRMVLPRSVTDFRATEYDVTRNIINATVKTIRWNGPFIDSVIGQEAPSQVFILINVENWTIDPNIYSEIGIEFYAEYSYSGGTYQLTLSRIVDVAGTFKTISYGRVIPINWSFASFPVTLRLQPRLYAFNSSPTAITGGYVARFTTTQAFISYK